MEKAPSPEPRRSDNPVWDAWTVIARQANEWLLKHPQVNAVVLFYPEVHGFNPKTGDRFLEVKGELKQLGKPPLVPGKTLAKFYATIKTEGAAPERLIEVPGFMPPAGGTG